MYFLLIFGDLEFDPLDYGVSPFLHYDDAKKSAEMVRNKGLKCAIYRGKIVYEAEKDAQITAMAEITRLGQELQPEDYK